MGIGFWLIIVSLFGIYWMADKLNIGIISSALRLFKKMIQFILQSGDNQPVNEHPVTWRSDGNEVANKKESSVVNAVLQYPVMLSFVRVVGLLY